MVFSTLLWDRQHHYIAQVLLVECMGWLACLPAYLPPTILPLPPTKQRRTLVLFHFNINFPHEENSLDFHANMKKYFHIYAAVLPFASTTCQSSTHSWPHCLSSCAQASLFRLFFFAFFSHFCRMQPHSLAVTIFAAVVAASDTFHSSYI